MNVAKGLKVQGMMLANGLLCEAKTNAQQQQQQLKTKLADMIPDSLAFVVLFQGVEKSSKVRLDPTCHEKGTSKTKLFLSEGGSQKMPLEKLTGMLCATSKLETCGLWQLVVVACQVRMGTKMTSSRSVRKKCLWKN